MADDKNRLRKTYSFFRQQPVYASGGGGGSGELYWFSSTAGAIFTTGSVAIRGGSSGVDAPNDVGDGVFFYVSGSIDAKNTNYTSISVFGGDVVVSGSLKSLTALSGSLTKLADGTSYLIAGSNITITTGSNGAVTISSTTTGSGTQFFSSTTAGSIFTTGSTAFVGGEAGIDSPADKGTNVFFYVSGSISGSGANDKRALFGGDVVISGSLRQGPSTDARGLYSHAQGDSTIASGLHSHAEGLNTRASGEGSHAEGWDAVASGDYSHAEGYSTSASNNYSHAEGETTFASGIGSHAEGETTTASGDYSHAEGRTTTASGIYSHAEGWNAVASGDYSHAEGTGTASADYSHAEGIDTISSGIGAHAEGDRATASGQYSHAEGLLTVASNDYSHAEGEQTVASGYASHAEGSSTAAVGSYSLAAGVGTIASGSGQNVFGKYNSRNNTTSLFVIGDGTGTSNATRGDILRVNIGPSIGQGRFDVTGTISANVGLSGSLTRLTDGTSYLIAGSNITIVTGSNGAVTISSTASGGGDSFFSSTTAGSIFTTGSTAFVGGEAGVDSPADKGTNVFFYVSGSISGSGANDKRALFGGDVVISGSLRQGPSTDARGLYSHAEGTGTTASANAAHAEGANTTASGLYSHAEGLTTTASAIASHAEGQFTVASGWYSHAEGASSTASGTASHAQGSSTEAVGAYSLAAGIGTIASGTAQNVFGKYNLRSNASSLFIIGDGTATGDATRGDILRVNAGSSIGRGRFDVTGTISANIGLSGSLTRLTDGTSYLIAGAGVSIITGSSGAVTIASTGVPGGSTTQVQFNDGGTFGGDSGLTYDKTTDTLTGVNVVLSGDLTVNGTTATVNTTNLEIKDSVIGLGFSSGTVAVTNGDRGWIGSNLTAGTDAHVMNKWDNTNSEFVFARTASSATGSFAISSYSNLHANDIQGRIVTASLGFSGSLTRLANGTSYLVAGNNITISSASNGQVTISSTASGGGGGDSEAAYVVLSLTSSLSSERVLTPGTGLTLTDTGAGGNVTLAINDATVATVSGSTFTGIVKFNAGLSGSLTKLTDGTSYLIAGSNVTISTGSTGAVTISASGTAPGGIDTQVQFNDGGSSLGGDSGLTYNKSTDTLSVVNVSMTATNDQVWNLKDNSAGALNISAGTSNNRWTFNTGDGQERLGFWDGVRASFGDINDPDLNIQHDGTNSRIENKTGQLILSGANGLEITGTVKFAHGLSGSLTKLIDGTSYLVAGNNVTISSASNGQITISTTGGGSGSGDPNATYVVLSATGSLSSERVLTPGTGLTLADAGAGGNVTLTINDAIVATISGSTFTGVTKHNAGLSGSLTKLTDGTSYLIAGSGISITTGSSGAITITNDGTVGDITAVTAGTGLTGGGTSGAVSLAINDSIVATVSGTTFTGVTKHTSGLSGSLTKLTDGTSYLIAGTNVTITTSSNGSITISSTAGGGGGGGDSFFSSTTNASIFTTGSTAFRGSESSVDSPADKGTDVFFYVSGSSSNVALFGGNVVTSGSLSARNGLTGSLTKLVDGTSYLVAGNNVTITTSSNGSVTIQAAPGGTGYSKGYFLGSSQDVFGNIDVSSIGTLVNGYDEESDVDVYRNGQLLTAGASNDYTVPANNTVHFNTTLNPDDVITVRLLTTGSTSAPGNGTGNAYTTTFTNASLVGGVLTVNHGLTSQYVVVTVYDNTDYQIIPDEVVATSAGVSNIDLLSFGTLAGTWKVVIVDGSGNAGDITNVIASTGLSGGGTSGAVSLAINDSVVATVSGSTFTGITKHNAGLSGSLTKLIDGTSYIIAGSGISITTGSSGAITITNDGTVGDITAVNAGTGLSGGGTSGAVTLNINDSIVATVTGSTFTGTTTHRVGLISSGSSFFTGSLSVTGSLVVTGSQAYTVMRANSNTTSTTAVDWNNGNVQKFTLNANPTTFTFSNGNAGGTYILIVRQNSAGSYTISWPGAVSWPAGSIPTMTAGANKYDVYSFVYDGTTYFGAVNQNYT